MVTSSFDSDDIAVFTRYEGIIRFPLILNYFLHHWEMRAMSLSLIYGPLM